MQVAFFYGGKAATAVPHPRRLKEKTAVYIQKYV
jgi:hypothetical protein